MSWGYLMWQKNELGLPHVANTTKGLLRVPINKQGLPRDRNNTQGFPHDQNKDTYLHVLVYNYMSLQTHLHPGCPSRNTQRLPHDQIRTTIYIHILYADRYMCWLVIMSHYRHTFILVVLLIAGILFQCAKESDMKKKDKQGPECWHTYNAPSVKDRWHLLPFPDVDR